MEDLKRTWCLPGTAFEVPFKQMKQKHKGTWDLIILLGVSPETSNLKISNLRHPVPRWATEGSQHCKPILSHVPPLLLYRPLYRQLQERVYLKPPTMTPRWTTLGTNCVLLRVSTASPTTRHNYYHV